MTTQARSSDDASRLYKQLSDQISDENEAEIRRTYKQLLRNGESLGAIVGVAISSIREMQDRGEREESGSKSAEILEAKQVPAGLQQNVYEVALQRAPVVDAHIDRSNRDPELGGADGDDQPVDAVSARQRVHTEPTQVTSELEARRSTARAYRVGDTEIFDEPYPDITDDPRLISPAEAAQSTSFVSPLQSIGRLATRTIIVLTPALVAIVGIVFLLRGHRTADEYRAADLQPIVVSPTLAIAAGAAGLSGALSPAITVASAGLNEEKRPTVIMPSAAQTEKTTVTAATSVIVPTEAPVSPAEVSALLQRGDALLATGDFTSARLLYEAAADVGDASAAFKLGATFDPIFIDRANLRGVRADMERAIFWYWRARDLGSSDAEDVLETLNLAEP